MSETVVDTILAGEIPCGRVYKDLKPGKPADVARRTALASRRAIAALVLLASLGQLGCPARPPGDSWLAALDGGVLLPPGTWIDFRHRHTALASAGRQLPPTFLADVGDGWGVFESWGIWGLGRQSRLHFFLRSVKPYDLHLKCRAAPHPEDRRQTVEVTVNGHQIGTLEASTSWQRHHLAVPEGLLRPGQYGRARFVIEEKKGALLVPQRAVQELQNLHNVVVVGADDTVSFRSVTVGPRVDSLWVIEEGLEPGDTVVVEGLQRLRDGAKVSPKPAPPPGKGAEGAEAAHGGE